MLRLELDAAALKPLIALIVQETLDQLESDRAKVGDEIGLGEAKAAEAIDVPKHALRDARLRGEIAAARVGKRPIYLRQDLLNFLLARREQD